MEQYYEIDAEEKKILKEFDQGKLRSVHGRDKEIARYRSFTKSSLDRTKHINIRLSERDLQKIKVKAADKGLPYQTLVSSILHQYIRE